MSTNRRRGGLALADNPLDTLIGRVPGFGEAEPDTADVSETPPSPPPAATQTAIEQPAQQTAPHSEEFPPGVPLRDEQQTQAGVPVQQEVVQPKVTPAPSAHQQASSEKQQEQESRVPTVSIATRPSAREATKLAKVKKREAQPAGVSASRAYRIGTVLDPYRRRDGEAVRPLRLTLPVSLIESIQVLAIRNGRSTTALIQQLIEQYVRDNGEGL